MNRCRVLIAGLLLALLVSQVPLFLQLTLTPDAVLYDVQARCLLEGGVLYRDVLEPNLPGVVWIHAVVRSVGGWSPEVLRVFDLIVVFCSCWLLVRLAGGVAHPAISVAEFSPITRQTQTPSSGLSATFSPCEGEKGHYASSDGREGPRPFRPHLPKYTLMLVLLTFYLGTSEWCHCQRDVWMLLPSLAAVTLRLKVGRMMAAAAEPAGQRFEKVLAAPNRGTTPSSGLTATFSPCEGEKGRGERLKGDGDASFTALREWVLPRLSKSIIAMALLEGVLWAAAFWLKPFVAVPALAVILVSRRFAQSFGTWAWHSLALMFGGVITGAVGVLWMVQSGCWPHFADTLSGWNGDYFQSGRRRWTIDRYWYHAERFWPWILLHVPAIVISIRGVVAIPVVGRRSPDGTSADQPSLPTSYSDLSALDTPRRTGPTLRCTATCESLSETLLQALYLGWMLQAFLLQQMFDYIHTPCVLLAIAVCGRKVSIIQRALIDPRLRGRSVVTPIRWFLPAACLLFVFCVVLSSPLIRPARMKHWPECIRACFGAELTSTTRDDLALSPFPRWSELQSMLDHVESAQTPDRSVMTYSCFLIHLYPELTFRPPTRFVYLDVHARIFPERRAEMQAAVAASGAKWVVSDLIEDGWQGELDDGVLLPEEISRNKATMFFPYNQTPVFRSGGYVLFRIDQPIGELTDEYFPLAEIGE